MQICVKLVKYGQNLIPGAEKHANNDKIWRQKRTAKKCLRERIQGTFFCKFQHFVPWLSSKSEKCPWTPAKSPCKFWFWSKEYGTFLNHWTIIEIYNANFSEIREIPDKCAPSSAKHDANWWRHYFSLNCDLHRYLRTKIAIFRFLSNFLVFGLAQRGIRKF